MKISHNVSGLCGLWNDLWFDEFLHSKITVARLMYNIYHQTSFIDDVYSARHSCCFTQVLLTYFEKP